MVHVVSDTRVPFVGAGKTVESVFDLDTTGSIAYASNTLRLHVDGGQARHNSRVHGPARGCWPTGPKPAPTTGSPIDRMEEFFKRSDRPTRDAVARTFRDVGAECTLNTMGLTYPDQNRIVPCDPFWCFIPTEQVACHSVDRGAVLVHEATRLRRCGAPLATTTITTPSLGTRSRPISTALTRMSFLPSRLMASCVIKTTTGARGVTGQAA
ncbi:Neutral protease [Metarhizium anisopliae]|nr:Neutral protease [Metarhizium anisopliae]